RIIEFFMSKEEMMLTDKEMFLLKFGDYTRQIFYSNSLNKYYCKIKVMKNGLHKKQIVIDCTSGFFNTPEEAITITTPRKLRILIRR
ncbi:MAG: hypothetical protein RMI01_09795, partial [Thermodesulfovibrio sp.]|nr:hypothetical protein [Thermodesulfovibrio sp.]